MTPITLADFIQQHTINGVNESPDWVAVDVVFETFHCFANADAVVLRELVMKQRHQHGGAINMFDGRPHNYIELGSWLGSQELALRLIALGSVIGLWERVTPRTLGVTDVGAARTLAGMGMIAAVVYDGHAEWRIETPGSVTEDRVREICEEVYPIIEAPGPLNEERVRQIVSEELYKHSPVDDSAIE